MVSPEWETSSVNRATQGSRHDNISLIFHHFLFYTFPVLSAHVFRTEQELLRLLAKSTPVTTYPISIYFSPVSQLRSGARRHK